MNIGNVDSRAHHVQRRDAEAHTRRQIARQEPARRSGHALSKGVSFGGLDEDGSMVVVDVSDIRE